MDVCVYCTFRNNKEGFAGLITSLEGMPCCKGMTLSSLLSMPMDHLTDLPLLIKAVLLRLESQSADATQADDLQRNLSKVCVSLLVLEKNEYIKNAPTFNFI